MSKWYIIENGVIFVAACILFVLLFQSTQSFHSFWIFLVAAFFINSPK